MTRPLPRLALARPRDLPGLEVALAAWTLLAACGEAEAPAAIAEVRLPARLRVGSPVEVIGRGLAGRSLLLQGSALPVALQWGGQRDDGWERSWGHVPADAQWRDGQRLAQVCLTGEDLQGWRRCLAVDARFASDWQPVLGEIVAPQPWRWGQVAAVQGADLLLPGEGEQRLQVDSGGAVREVPLTTDLGGGREHAALAIAPGWLGPQPGARQWRARLVGWARRPDGAVIARQSPWSGWHGAEVEAPRLVANPHMRGWRRGDWAPAVAQGVAEDSSWRLQWSGAWHGLGAAPLAMAADTPAGPGGFSPVSSAWWRQSLPWARLPQRFAGEVRLRVSDGDDSWLGPPLPLTAPLLAIEQRVELEAGAAWRAALQRFGLAAHQQAVEAALLQRLQGLFAGYAVTCELVATPRWDGRERLRLRLGDLDGNGQHLLGADGSASKDTGNQQLDEQLGGFDPAAWQAGQVAISGVFVGELLGFSARLRPDLPAATPAFDAVFAPWSPPLGGAAAGPAQAAAAATAIEQLAWAVAEVCAHEVGHALGLAAGTTQAHHPGDHPGWIMDSGAARPWAERAGLPGAAPSQWGPIDAAYLRSILPLPQPH